MMNANSPYQEVIDRLVATLSSVQAEVSAYKVLVVRVVPPPDRISARELQLVELLASGHTKPEIAALLGLSTETVRTHLSRLRARWNAKTSSQLVSIAKDAQLLPPPSRTQ